MKVTFGISGSHGDIRPIVALGQVFSENGHEVQLITSSKNARFAEGYGFKVIESGLEWYDFLNNDIGKAKNVFAMAKKMKSFLIKEVQIQFSLNPRIISDSDLIIGAGFQFAMRSQAQKAQKQYFHIFHTPQVIYSSKLPPLSAMFFDLPGWMNRMWWASHKAAYNNFLKHVINHERRNLGLPLIKDVWDYFAQTGMIATDRQISSLPIQENQAIKQGGYPFLLDEKSSLPAELFKFMAGDKKIIYFGFGSSPDFAKTELTHLLKMIIQKFDVKIVMQSPNPLNEHELRDIEVSQRIFWLNPCSHLELFPYMNAIIHHGGAGTTHNALVSGVPQLIIGFAMDQYYWGNQVYRLGLGPKPLSILNITQNQLIKGIGELLDTSVYQVNANKYRNDGTILTGAKLTYDKLMELVNQV